MHVVCILNLELDGKVYIAGGCSNVSLSTSLDSSEAYDIETDVWSPLPKMSTSRCVFGAASFENHFCAVGGIDKTENRLASMECFNPSTRRWHMKANMKIKRSYHSVSVLQGYLYAIAGYSSDYKWIKSCERYSMKTNKWTYISDLPIGLSGSSAATLMGKIYVVGGGYNDPSSTASDRFVFSKAFYRFSPSKNT